jgi:hypothetical protein
MQNRISGERPHAPPVDLEVFRVRKNEQHQLRTLAGPGEDTRGRVLGYHTHWDGHVSQACLGVPDCPPSLHRVKAVWYGYVAVERWSDELRLWLPCVLQVTESLELDFRDKLKRGQYWTLAMDGRKKKGNAARGQLDGPCDLVELPHPFDILPVVRALYHVADLRPPWVPNPAPGRIALAPSLGAPPPGSQAAQKQEETRQPVPSEGVQPNFKSFKAEFERRGRQSNGKH